MAGDPFTSAIFTWLNRVASDGTLPPAAFKLAYIISQHINRKSRIAWPSQETLAEAMGLKSERSIRRLSEALEAGGHLLTTRRKQTSLVYRLAQDRTELSYLEEQEPTEGEPAVVDNPESRPDENVRSYDQDRTFLSSRPDIPVLKTGQECPPNHLNNHLRNQESCRVAKATPTKNEYSEDFETNFWKPFPRTPIMSKKEAWREWMKLDPEQRLAHCRAVEPYKRHLKQNPTLHAVHACRFLSQNRAEGILEIAAEKPKFDIRSSML
jgi:hypothetical protein